MPNSTCMSVSSSVLAEFSRHISFGIVAYILHPSLPHSPLISPCRIPLELALDPDHSFVLPVKLPDKEQTAAGLATMVQVSHSY
jgi:hypothetical protein